MSLGPVDPHVQHRSFDFILASRGEPLGWFERERDTINSALLKIPRLDLQTKDCGRTRIKEPHVTFTVSTGGNCSGLNSIPQNDVP